MNWWRDVGDDLAVSRTLLSGTGGAGGRCERRCHERGWVSRMRMSVEGGDGILCHRDECFRLATIIIMSDAPPSAGGHPRPLSHVNT